MADLRARSAVRTHSIARTRHTQCRRYDSSSVAIGDRCRGEEEEDPDVVGIDLLLPL